VPFHFINTHYLLSAPLSKCDKEELLDFSKNSIK